MRLARTGEGLAMLSSRSFKALLPKRNQRLPIQRVHRVKRFKEFLPVTRGQWRKLNCWQFQSSQQLRQKQARDATVEIREWVNGQKPSLGECQQFKEQRIVIAQCAHACVQIREVI